MDHMTKSVAELIGGNGYQVFLGPDSVTAHQTESGQTHIVRYHDGNTYRAVVELAVQLGMELDDG